MPDKPRHVLNMNVYEVLARFVMHNNFVKGIRTLYSKLSARITINSYLLDIILLERGTRQGCPHFLFATLNHIELLVQWIRQTKSITLCYGKDYVLSSSQETWVYKILDHVDQICKAIMARFCGGVE